MPIVNTASVADKKKGMRTVRLILLVGLALASGRASLWSKDVLILYDGVKERSEAYIDAHYISNLLGHFAIGRKEIVHPSQYHPRQAATADLVFVICNENQPPLPASLLKDLQRARGDIVWLNIRIETFLRNSPHDYGIAWDQIEKRRDWKIFYKGIDFTKEDSALNRIRVNAAERVQIFSEIQDGQGHRYPYILKTGNLWYVADSPFSYAEEGGRYLIFADLLHDILGQSHPVSRHALVRLEDITPDDEPDKLKNVIDYLYREGIPFQTGVIPIYKNPNEQYEVFLSESPDMVKALKYGVGHGGTIVMHGVTHQNRGASADDYELWDDIAGKPLEHESPDWLSQRLRGGLTEFFRNGLYPLAWETPHYAASYEDYRLIGKYFDTFYERVMATSFEGSEQLFPYPVRLSDIGISVVPENCGFVDSNHPDPQAVIATARRMLCVRDGVASFFYHPFLPVSYLKTIVEGFQALGWKFISLKDFKCNLRTGAQWVTSTGGSGKVTLSRQYLHELVQDRKGKIKKESFSDSRRTQVVNKIVNLSDGSLYVLEALDLLPLRQKTIFQTAGSWLHGLLASKKEKTGISFSRSLIIMSRNVSPEEEADQKSFLSVLTIFGFNPITYYLGTEKRFSLDGITFLAVPFGAAKRLMDIEVSTILDFVEKGGQLLTDGQTSLSRRLGLQFSERRVEVSEVRDLSAPMRLINWKPPAQLNPFALEGATVQCRDTVEDLPLAVSFPFGQGKVLFLGALFDPYTPYGSSRYPYLPYYLKESLDVPFIVHRNSLEFYFDPGLRQTVSWENLVRRWKLSGVKIVYLAAWHFYPAPSNYRFNYAYFISLCHSLGIAVYAWFEFPYVTPQLWQEHPEWREKNANLADSQPSWRLPLNLFQPQARQAVTEFLWKLLGELDWDGVNLAELHFETDEGLRNPGRFTPLNDEVRQRFKSQQKFDPLLLFKPGSSFFWQRNSRALKQFLTFRTELTRQLHIYFLTEIEKIKAAKKKEMEVIVTAMDSLLHPEIIEECGINTLDIVQLMERFSFTLQVEDPARSWADPPSRYAVYYQAYKPYIKDSQRLMFDINVVPRDKVESTHLPSALAVGSELATTLFYAAAPSGRAGIYSEYTVNPFDMDLLPYVMGSDVQWREQDNGFAIRSKQPITLAFNNPEYVPFLDGQMWPFFGPRGISLPSGEHRLVLKKSRFFDLSGMATRLGFDGDMFDLSLESNAYSLRYLSPTPVALTFTKPLEQVRVDAQPLDIPGGGGSLILPRGEHRLEIYLESPPSYMVDVVGYLSSKLFLVLGLFSVSLLLLMYFYSRSRR